MRFHFPAAALCVMGLVASAPVMAQSKIAVIDFQRAVVESAEFKQAYSQLETKYKPKQDALAKAQLELADIETQLRSSQGQLSPAGQAQLQANGQRKQVLVERLQMDLQEDFEGDRDAALRLVSGRMNELLKKFCDEKKIDLLVDSTATHFSKSADDVTDQAVAAYNAAHPAK
ncbi:MAG: OmpH family outer membrane protein [Acidobacteriota bacterium]